METKEKKGPRMITTSNLRPEKRRERKAILTTHDLPEVLPKPGFAIEKEAETKEEENEEK